MINTEAEAAREGIARIIDPEAFKSSDDYLMKLNVLFPPIDDEQADMNIALRQ